MNPQIHKYVVSWDIIFDKKISYYPPQVVSFENINHDNESSICSKSMVEFPLSSNAPMDFSLSSSLYISIPIISSSPMVEQSDI